MFPKSGWKTSEFWVSVASQFLSLLVIIGVLGSQDRATLEGAITGAVAAVFTLVSSAAVVWKYITSRTEVKAHALMQGLQEPRHPDTY